MKRWRFFKHERIVLSRPDDGSPGELHRWRLIETPIGGMMLHRHVGPDPGRRLHDHPWSFCSIILRGGYVEELATTRSACELAAIAEGWGPTTNMPHGTRFTRLRGTAHVVRLDHAHRIVSLLQVPTWTLVLHGRRHRPWGFYTPDGFVDEKQHDRAFVQ